MKRILTLILFALTSPLCAQIMPAVSAAQSSSLSKGLVFWLKFDECSATATAIDSSSSGFNALWTGTTTGTTSGYYSPGHVGPCSGQFDGSTDDLNLASSSDLSFEYTQPFSIGVWIKTSYIGAQIIFSKEQNSGNYTGYGFLLQSTCNLSFGLVNSSTKSIGVNGVDSLCDGNFHHVLGTYNGSGLVSGISLYVDGFPETSTVVSNTLASSSIINSVVAQVSSRGGGAVAFPFNGQMDNLQVWNRALSATEAFNLWQSQQVGAYPLVDNLWYPANNTTASTIPGCLEAANASVTGGTLVITTLYQTETCISSASGTGTLSSALKNYTAEDLYNPQPFLYGTFEIKIQLAGPAALNSTSFWLLSTACLPNPFQNVFARPICVTRTTTNYRELDIVENGFQGLGEVGQNIYTDTIDQTFNTAVSTGTSAPHIYDVVWTPTGVVFEIDGVVTAQYPTTTLTIPMFMILDSGPGSGAVPTNYPQTATIYYVKHWNLAGQLDFNYVPF